MKRFWQQRVEPPVGTSCLNSEQGGLPEQGSSSNVMPVQQTGHNKDNAQQYYDFFNLGVPYAYPQPGTSVLKANTSTHVLVTDPCPSSNRKVTHPAEPPEKRVRKRQRNEGDWAKNDAKKKRNSGQSYFSIKTTKNMDGSVQKKKVERQARLMMAPCGESCKLRCSFKISEDSRQKLFDAYWKLGSYQRQRDFISSCLTFIVNKRHKNAEPEVSKKKCNPHCAFHLIVDERKERVCKTFFLSTLGIGARVVRTVVEKRLEVNCGGILPEDQRGKHGNHKRCPESLKMAIRQHINSIPRIKSPYGRSDSRKEYIEGGKSLSQLYKDFVNHQKTRNEPHGNYLMYYNIFNSEFNISFFSPKQHKPTPTSSSGLNPAGHNKQTKFQGHPSQIIT